MMKKLLLFLLVTSFATVLPAAAPGASPEAVELQPYVKQYGDLIRQWRQDVAEWRAADDKAKRLRKDLQKKYHPDKAKAAGGSKFALYTVLWHLMAKEKIFSYGGLTEAAERAAQERAAQQEAAREKAAWERAAREEAERERVAQEAAREGAKPTEERLLSAIAARNDQLVKEILNGGGITQEILAKAEQQIVATEQRGEWSNNRVVANKIDRIWTSLEGFARENDMKFTAKSNISPDDLW